MAEEIGNRLSDSFVSLLTRMSKDYLRGALGGNGSSSAPSRKASGLTNIVAILLEDLTNVGTARASLLSLEPVGSIQYVRLLGSIIGGSFTLSFKPDKKDTTPAEVSVDIQWDATDQDVRDALLALPSLSPGDVLVEKLPGCWIVSFGGNYRDVDLPVMGVVGTPLKKASGQVGDIEVLNESWVDTGTVVDVRLPIPVAAPTPAKKGALVVCVPVAGAGYIVVALECRQIEFVSSYGSYS